MATHPVFLPGKSYRQKGLGGYSPRGRKRIRHDLGTKPPPPQLALYYIINLKVAKGVALNCFHKGKKVLHEVICIKYLGCGNHFTMYMYIKTLWGFPSSPVVKNPSSNTGDTSLIPGQRTKIPHTAGELSLRTD